MGFACPNEADESPEAPSDMKYYKVGWIAKVTLSIDKQAEKDDIIDASQAIFTGETAL